MTIEFANRLGAIEYRTLTRRNIRKVAHSIQAAHSGHPLSHTIAFLEYALTSGRDQLRMTCDVHEGKSRRRR